MSTFVKTITQDKVNYEFLRSLNGIMGLTQRELEVFELILSIETAGSRLRPKKRYVDTKDTRKQIMSESGVTRDNLSRYMSTFKAKGLLVLEKDDYIINKALIPLVIGGTTVQITLVLKIK